MKLADVYAETKQGLAICSSILGTAIAEHAVHGTWPSTAYLIVGLILGGLSAWKVPPSPTLAKRALTHRTSMGAPAEDQVVVARLVEATSALTSAIDRIGTDVANALHKRLRG